MKKLVNAILWFSFAQFVVLLITGLFGITPIEETFFPTLGMVAVFGFWNAINRERQKKLDWIEANRRHREAILAGGKRASWPPQRPADAGAQFHVEADLDHLRRTLDKTVNRAGVEPSRPWTDHSRKPSSRTPDQYSRRTDPKPADTVTTTPDAITNPAHPLHQATYGSTFGNTNADSYPAKAPCAPASSSHSSYDSSPSYSCSSDSGSSSSSDSGSCGGGGGCD